MRIRELTVCEKHRGWYPSKCPACHINELTKDAQKSLDGAYATNRQRHELGLELAKLHEENQRLRSFVQDIADCGGFIGEAATMQLKQLKEGE